MSNAAAFVRVATIHIAEAFDLSRQHESAAQYHTIRVEPGAYPVEVLTSNGRRYVVARFSGLCVSSGYGAKRYADKIGRPSEVSTYPYKYQLRTGRYLGRVEIHDAGTLESAEGV